MAIDKERPHYLKELAVQLNRTSFAYMITSAQNGEKWAIYKLRDALFEVDVFTLRLGNRKEAEIEVIRKTDASRPVPVTSDTITEEQVRQTQLECPEKISYQCMAEALDLPYSRTVGGLPNHQAAGSVVIARELCVKVWNTECLKALTEIVCPTCEGDGRIEQDEIEFECPSCDGRGNK
jgi:hypothetical protein